MRKRKAQKPAKLPAWLPRDLAADYRALRKRVGKAKAEKTVREKLTRGGEM